MSNDHPEWHYSIEGRKAGPVSALKLRALAERGELRPNDLVWKPGLKSWVSAAKVRGLFPSPESRRPEVVAPPPPPPLQPSDGSLSSPSPISCFYGEKTQTLADYSQRVKDPVQATLSLSSDGLSLRVLPVSGAVVTIPLSELSPIAETAEGGFIIAGPAVRTLFSKRPCVQLSPLELASLQALLPKEHPVSVTVREMMEGREFVAAMEKGQRFAPAVYSMVGLCIAAFVFQVMNLSDRGSTWDRFAPEDLIRHGGNWLPLIQSGGWHRILVQGFLHGGIIHLFVNVLALAQIGPFCERLLGTRSFVCVYLTALLGSSWVSAVAHGDAVVSVGASGAIFGVVGIMLAAAARRALPNVLRKRMFGMAAGFVAFQVYAEVKGLSTGGSGIDQIAHATGLAIGFIVGYFSVVPGANGPARGPTWRVVAASSGLLAVVIVGGFGWLLLGAAASGPLQQERSISPAGAWTGSVMRASVPQFGMSAKEQIDLIASMPQTTECVAQYYAAVVLLQASNEDRGPKFEQARDRLSSLLGQDCSIGQAGYATLQASEELREGRLDGAAAQAQRAVELLRAAARESVTRQVENASLEGAAALSLGGGCYTVCELYLNSGFDESLVPSCCSAFELMEELISSGRIEADPEFLGWSSRAAAAALVSQIGSGSNAHDRVLITQAQAALQIEWTPGTSLHDANALLAEAIAWGGLDDADKARAALTRAVPIYEAAGQDVAEMRALLKQDDRELLRVLKESGR